MDNISPRRYGRKQSKGEMDRGLKMLSDCYQWQEMVTQSSGKKMVLK